MNSMTCKKLVLSSAAALGFALTGCGGSSPEATTGITGIAAVGAPIVNGTVNIQCAAGNAIASTTTSNDGVFQFNLTGQTLPCAVQVSGGMVNSVTNATPYHSIAVTVGTVNVTPMTDLLLANLAATATPSTWFTALGTSKTPLTTINQTAVDASIAKIRSTLAALAPLVTLNPVTSAFTAAAGNSMDDTLAAFKAAMTKASVSYSTLLSAAATPAFTAPTGFSAALGNTFAATVSGGSMVVPAAPEGLAASASSSTDISLSWTAVTGATSYAVYRSSAANVQVSEANKVDTVTTPASTSTGLTASTAYFYKVTASNAAGESVASAEVNASTNNPVTVTPPAGGGGANANALSSGTDYGIIYSGSANTPPAGPNPGIDNRTPISAQFDSAGNMTGYTASVSEAPTIGSASVGELATDGIMSIGRWTNGALAGAFYSVLPVFDANHGLHYAVTNPTLISAVPTTGTVTYQLAAATKPTYLDGHAAPGTLT
ncbi:MAG: fibronectin type III domain-containing protein, partial [Rhodoferax sp.]|nr:fibronectin type III domain-containing protein [Rhodoferax sp.]